MIKFEWDETKNIRNIRNHGIDFNDVKEMFYHHMLTYIDNRFNYGEERWVGTGFLKGLIAVVVYSENDSKGVIRIFSARKATRNEIKSFTETIGH